MLLVTVDRSSATPAYRQIRDQVMGLIDDGTLLPGDRLPATRSMATTSGLHRSTVVRAYNELRALGYIESRVGSYSTVRRRARRPSTATSGAGPVELSGLIDWGAAATPAVRQLASSRLIAESQMEVPPDLVDLERLAADPTLAPDGQLRRDIKHILARSGGAALDYAEPSGWQPLREVISIRMRSHGVSVSPDEILITAGAQHALDLVLRMLCSPGDAAVVEAPTYGMAHSLLQLHGVHPIEVPMRGGGMDLDALSRALREHRPRVVYTMPNFHNPTGVTTDQAHRERLLALCEQHQVPIIEDGFEEEMKYFGQAVLPIKSMDARGITLYVGTYSKVVFPGLRVGWVAAPPDAIARLTAILHASCLAGNTLAQAAAARFTAGGQFEAYLRRVHRVYRRRMTTMLTCLERHMPAGVEWTTPSGGYTVWLTLPTSSAKEEPLLMHLKRGGVKVGPGNRHFRRPPRAQSLRLCIACVDESRIELGCRRVAESLQEWMSLTTT